MGNFSLSSSSHTSSSKTDNTSAMTPELRINISQIALKLNTRKFIVLYTKLFEMIEPCYKKKLPLFVAKLSVKVFGCVEINSGVGE